MADRSTWQLIFWVFWGISVKAQIFTLKGGAIKDYAGTYVKQDFNVAVYGLPTSADSSYGLEAVVFTLHHDQVSDIKITLEAPDGTSVWLTNRNGKDTGRHYLNTRFSQFGKNGQISASSAPFTGDFVPDGRLEFVNNGQNPNGLWKISVEDLKEGVTGTLDWIQLIFSNQPAALVKARPCSLEAVGQCACPDEKANCELLPDLIIVPVFTYNQIQEYPWNHKTYPGQLRFAASIANIGDGPLEIIGTNEWICGEQRVDTCRVLSRWQYEPTESKAENLLEKWGAIAESGKEAGTMYIENLPGHNHYHVDDWVEFRLVKIENGYREIVAKGKKVSYCLYTTGSCYHKDGLCVIDGKNYGETMPKFGMGNYQTCNFDKQGISVGGFDTYGMLYEGQFIDLPRNLTSGDYFLEIEIDPHHIYSETNRKNNVFQMKYRLTKQERK